ncbi:conjugal transfer protein TraG, partial [Bacillus sp. AFS098217]
MDTFKRKIPLLVTITLICGFIISFVVGLVNYIKLLYYAFEPPTHTIEITYVPLVLMFFSLVLGDLSFRFYSRIPNLHVKNGKLILLIASHIAVDVHFLWFATAPIHAKVIPYLSEKAAYVNFGEYKAIGEVLAGNFHTLTLIFVFLPTAFMILFTLWYSGHIVRYRNEILDWIKKYEYKNQRLQKWFNSQEEQVYPDVEIGPHIEHKEMVRIKGKDRTLNGIIVGPIGSGKTASLIIPMINQDLHWMVRFINQFEKAYKKKDYNSEEVKGTFLNGVTVIEPSNDLCQKVFKLVQAHQIPESSVYYIDPTNPDTKNINILRGPVDKVAEVFAMVIQGLSESNNAFFEQAQRNHLKQHIYLLKLHNPQKDVTFDDLIQMYDDVERVHRMHVLLKVQVEKLHDFVQSGAATRDQKNEYKIIKGIDEWFDNTIREKLDNQGEPAVYKTGKYRTQPMHYDREEEYVKGLRNILKDLASNVLIRRVLFGKSDFDFDIHLEQGGILLVNTAKGELADLSNVLGKFVLLSMQNAVFRREPNVSPYHHLVIDEFPDYGMPSS